MGEITERLPAPQYNAPAFKRTNSQPQMKLDAIDSDGPAAIKGGALSAAKSRPSAPANGGRSAPNEVVSNTPKSLSSLALGGNQHVEVESKSLI